MGKLSRLTSTISAVILVGLIFFSVAAAVVLPNFAIAAILGAAVLLALLSNYKNHRLKISLQITKTFWPWVVFSLFAVINMNQNLYGSLRIICGLLFAFFIRQNTNWINAAVKAFLLFSGIYVFFTYFFLAFPQFYKYVIKFYGFIPTGTFNGAQGFRGGIADHFSQNGMYISLCFIMLFTIMTVNSRFRDKKYVKILYAAIALSVGALLLTQKRGFLLYTFLCAAVTYIIACKVKGKAAMKFIFLVLIALLLFSVAVKYIPELGLVVERFERLGDDKSSSERSAMLGLAIDEFKKKPLFGNGFWSYRNAYASKLFAVFQTRTTKAYKFLHAHNVYAQVLCECGIVGEIIYLTALGGVLVKTQMLLRRLENFNNTERLAVVVSFSLQMFYLMYSFTGNCLYDMGIYYYSLALAFMMSADYSSKKHAVNRRITE